MLVSYEMRIDEGMMDMGEWRDVFDIKRDSAPVEEIAARIDADSTVKGANLVILIMAIFIASVGLNMNSVAVIIGAMLISPLMGGIVATGYGMATYDMHFIKKSLVKLSFQVVFALLTAAVYFSLTPITTPSPEMLARTAPTAWDVIIALCGGIAGAIGNTRQEKSNVIPGVAIATALMPPLCTAGYGIAAHSFHFFGGALYLFFINCFFITFSSFLIFKILRVPVCGGVSEAHFRYQRWFLIVCGLVVTVPSLYMAYVTANENIRDSQVKSFISQDMDLEASSVVAYELDHGVLTVDVIGAPLDDREIERLQASLHQYGQLRQTTLKVVQGPASQLNQEQVQEIINARLANELKNDSGKSYKELANQYYGSYKRDAADQNLLRSLNRQAPVLFPAVQQISGGTLSSFDGAEEAEGRQWLAYIVVSRQLTADEAGRLQQWIQTQADMPVVVNIQLQDTPSQFYGNGIDWNL